MLATVANLAIVVAMCMAVMVGAISTEAPEASPAMADTIAEEEYMAGVAEDERPQLCTPNLEFLHPQLHALLEELAARPVHTNRSNASDQSNY